MSPGEAGTPSVPWGDEAYVRGHHTFSAKHQRANMPGFMAHATLLPGDNARGPVSVRLDLGTLTCEVHRIYTCHKIPFFSTSPANT